MTRAPDTPLALGAALLVALPLAAAAAVQPVLAVGAVLAVLMGLLVLFRPDLVLLVLVAALPWEDTLAPPSSPLPVVKILGFLLIVSWAIDLARGRSPLRLPSVLVAVAAFVFTIGVSFVLSPDQVASQSKTSSYLLFALFFFVVLQLVRDHDQVRRVIAVITLSAAAAATKGLYALLVQGLDRAAGPIEDPNGYAYVLAAVLPLVGYLVATDRPRRLLWSACFALIAAAVAATLSRGSIVGLATLVLWALISGRASFRGAVAGGAGLLAVGALVFALLTPDIDARIERKQSYGEKNVASRQAFWRGALAMAADRPLTGVGPARFGAEAQQYIKRNPVALRDPVVHNSYLEILAESGIFALGAFLTFLVASWRLLALGRARAREAADADASRLASALQGTLIVALVSGAFISAQLTTPFWLIGGLAAVFALSPPAPAGRAARGSVPRPTAVLRPSVP